MAAVGPVTRLQAAFWALLTRQGRQAPLNPHNLHRGRGDQLANPSQWLRIATRRGSGPPHLVFWRERQHARRRGPLSTLYNKRRSGRSPTESKILGKRRARQEAIPYTSVVDKIATIAFYMDPPPTQQVPDPDQDARVPDTQTSRDALDMPPPPVPTRAEDASDSRSSRATSPNSRNTHRLSLTLPIAPPTSGPSRPTPTSSTVSSYPPTPIDTPALASPSDPSDFIIAIAAQERRVLELREELSQAEAELKRLKKQWAYTEAHKKRSQTRRTEQMRQMAPQRDAAAAGDDAATRRSVELDRRKALLQGQMSQQSTPNPHRRKVLRGGHTRTLSLLSPARPQDSLSLHEDQSDTASQSSRASILDSGVDEPSPATSALLSPATLSKRASWAPRSVQQVAMSSGMKQMAEDFKQGLWTFVEDLRQATVGEEPITGVGRNPRTAAAGHSQPQQSQSQRQTSGSYRYDGEQQETIRASATAPRGRAMTAFDETPSPAERFADPAGAAAEHKDREPQEPKPKAGAATSKEAKRFSWAPLTIESYDNDDWSNWDSPTVRSPRWSGSTVNGDIIPGVPGERGSGRFESSPRKSPRAATGSAGTPSRRGSSPTGANKLDELLPSVLNRLTPSNIKRGADHLMKEWERSLATPAEETTAAAAAAVVTASTGPAKDKSS